MNDPWRALVPAALTAAGGFWAALMTSAVHRRLPRGRVNPQPRIVAARYGIALAVLLGLTAALAAVWFEGTTAGWALLTILVIVRPDLSDTRRRLGHRILGTVAGGLVAAPLASVVPVRPVLLLVGAVCAALVVVFQFVTVPYAVYAFVLTLSVVLLSTPVASVAAVDAQRVAYTLAGALMIVIGSIVAMPLIRRRRPLP